MAKLLILGPSYRRNPSPEPLPAIERYDGQFYRIVRKYMDELREKDVDVIIITEDLDVVTPEMKLPYKPPTGDQWKVFQPSVKDSEKVRKLQEQILEVVKSKRYDEIFIALNRYYRQLLPDLTPYANKVIAYSKGFGKKMRYLKEWLTR